MPEHLMQVSPEEFTICRQKWGRGYRYCKGDEKIEDQSLMEHFNQLGIPATWNDVWLCDNPDSYILASGYDGSGKLQYLYHPDYMEFRNSLKFEKLVDFGHSLPRIRRRLRKDLHQAEWTETKLLALIVRILDKYHLRIGSRVYARKNKSFGLTTLRKKHLREEDNSVLIEYIGKSGQERKIQMNDPELVSLIEEIADFPGWELFSFEANGERLSADASKVNTYIREISGGDFSARNFRTWAATVLSIKYLPAARREVEENPRRKLSAALVDKVSTKLGNTPSICRNYYIHPDVLDQIIDDKFDPSPCDQRFLKNTLYRKYECRTMEILTNL